MKRDFSPSSSPSSTSLKRKRNAGDDEKYKKSMRRNTRDESIDLENGVDMAIGKLDGQLLADYVAQRTKRFQCDLSLVEVEDKRIPGKAFRDTSSWEKQRLLEHLPDFLEQYTSRPGQSKNLNVSSKKMGAPHTIVVTSAGLRAANITRVLRTFQTKDAIVAKLFAKHIKLKDATAYVKKTRISIGVGTPSRLLDLLDSGSLSSEKLERIVVDCSHIDQKRRGILDMRETLQAVVQLLNRPEIKERYGASTGGIELLFY